MANQYFSYLVAQMVVVIASMGSLAQAANSPLDVLTATSDQTPFQKMQTLYNAATPMQLSQFLTPSDPGIRNWTCAGVKPDTMPNQITPYAVAPVLAQGTVIVSPAVPPSGPLFPGTPEKDEAVEEIILIANDGSWNFTPEAVGLDYTSTKVQITTSPTVSESYLNNPSDPTSEVTATYRMSDNLILVKEESSNASVMASIDDYFYCYKN